MRTDVQRAAKYDAKYVASTVNLKVAARLDTMKSRFASKTASLYAAEVAIQGVLNAKTPRIPTIQYPFYLCFGRQLWRLKESGFVGPSLDGEAQVFHDKWETTGLDSAVMVQIADDVFGITVT